MIHHGYSLENEIYWGGLSCARESKSLDLWAHAAKHSNIIMDIGANTGIYALVAKCANPKAKIHAFEPVQRIYEKLSANVRLNNFDIKCLDFALSDKDGEAILHDETSEHVYGATLGTPNVEHWKDIVETKVVTRRADSYMREAGLASVDLVKVDVETFEPQVLAGFGDVLAASRPALLVEILEDRFAERIEPLLSGIGYLYFNIDERKGARRVEHLTKSSTFNFFICDKSRAAQLDLSV